MFWRVGGKVGGKVGTTSSLVGGFSPVKHVAQEPIIIIIIIILVQRRSEFWERKNRNDSDKSKEDSEKIQERSKINEPTVLRKKISEKISLSFQIFETLFRFTPRGLCRSRIIFSVYHCL